MFVSGKHYYTLAKYIEENSVAGVALVRLESLCPFPAARIQEEVKRFKNAKKFIWSQVVRIFHPQNICLQYLDTCM